MEDNKNLPKTEMDEIDFDELGNLCDNIVNEKIYDNGRDWTSEEIELFVEQFKVFEGEENIVDMDKLDPKFITKKHLKEKFSGFDDNVIDILYECENKKLEDARIAPLRVNNKNVTLTDNLSNITYIDEEEYSISKTKCKTSSENSSCGKTEEKKEEEEEVSV